MLSSSLMDGLYGCAAWIILLAIHAVHAATLLLNLVHHLFTSLRSGGTRLASPSWSADAARWQGHKIPQTLGIIFVPAARGRFNWRRARYEPWPESHVLEGMQVDLEAMVRWCCKLGVKDLILYDEHGKSPKVYWQSLRLFHSAHSFVYSKTCAFSFAQEYFGATLTRCARSCSDYPTKTMAMISL